MTTKTSLPWSPLRLFVFIWAAVATLYALNLSELQVHKPGEITFVILLFLGPFLFGYLFSTVLTRSQPRVFSVSTTRAARDSIRRFTRRTNSFTLLFALIISTEIAIEGYIPLLSMLQGHRISQFDFGISSLHGAALALGTFCATANYYVFCTTKSRRSLIVALAILVTFALLVTRKMMIVAAIQMLFVHMAVSGPPKLRTSLSSALILLGLVYVFGWIGDVRTGRDLFLSLAHPTFPYPDWLPSGPMWTYIYIVTPILNLTNATLNISAYSYDFEFACSLLPGLFRTAAGCSELGFDNEYQISGAFNVATGYIPFYMSWGAWGIATFSVFHGFIAAHCYRHLRPFPSSTLYYAIIMQITLLMIFGNGFFNLNVAFQFIILFIYRIRLFTETPQPRHRLHSPP